ncbi:Protein LURP-one-related like [Actinidia chinensis var. chinensis]|uniref:Protein LURP-one-related like n=1 Tax=Actinidia chinensis var. chinensis TaxID=1590841 RepID=A0A2R6R8I2_ACTCC|nr:Protein LURP-one-related like [Actinidia chinensis var. chinensis]
MDKVYNAAVAGGNPFWVIGPQFCGPHLLDLVIDKKPLCTSQGKFIVTDTKGNLLFKVKKPHLKICDERFLIDASGYHIVTLKEKMLTAHSRWEVCNGNNSVFSAKRSHAIQLKTKLQVFLANNVHEHICDFRVEGSWTESSCVIYAGESSTIIAQMHKKRSVGSVVLGKDKFIVTVYPHVDYAFIVALIVILDEIN